MTTSNNPASSTSTSNAATTENSSPPYPKVVVHHLNKSRSQRLLWLLEELSIPYILKLYTRGSDFRAPAELKGVHELGKSPVVEITEPNGKSIVLAESGFIFEYLVGRFGGLEKGLVPKRYDGETANTYQAGKEDEETEAWRRYSFYMHYTEGSLMPPLVIGLIVDGIRNAPVPFFLRPVVRGVAAKIESSFLSAEFSKNFDFLESQLPASPTTGFPSITTSGSLTAADILISFPLLAAVKRGIVMGEKYPKIVKFSEACERSEGYKMAIQRVEKETGEKYEII